MQFLHVMTLRIVHLISWYFFSSLPFAPLLLFITLLLSVLVVTVLMQRDIIVVMEVIFVGLIVYSDPRG